MITESALLLASKQNLDPTAVRSRVLTFELKCAAMGCFASKKPPLPEKEQATTCKARHAARQAPQEDDEETKELIHAITQRIAPRLSRLVSAVAD